MMYLLTITCPLCGAASTRQSSAPFVYLDADGIDAYAQHTSNACPADSTTAYVVVRTPEVYRQLPGDPEPPGGDA